MIIGSPAPDQLAAPEGKGHELSPRKGIDLLIIREHLPDTLLDSGQIRGRGGASLAKVPSQVSGELEQAIFAITHIATCIGKVDALSGAEESQITMDHDRSRAIKDAGGGFRIDEIVG